MLSLVLYLSFSTFYVLCRAHISDLVRKYNAYLIKEQDAILEKFFGHGLCEKLYRYTHLVNGVAIMLTPDEVCTPHTCNHQVLFLKLESDILFLPKWK